MTKKIMFCFGVFMFFLMTVSVANCQDYPKKPIQLFIPFEVGQSADISARGVAAASEKFFKQPVVTVNKTGAGGSICFDYVATAKADGYSLGWLTASVLTQTNTGSLPYKYDAWDYVARINVMPTTITVKNGAPWKDLKEFIDYGKKNPGKLKIGNAGNGSFTHLIAAAFEEAVGIKVIHVPIGIRRLPSLLGGEVDAISVHPPEIVSLVTGGEMRILGVIYPKRMDEFPQVPTLEELGYKVKLLQFWGVFAPKGIPVPVKKYLAETFKKATTESSYRDLAAKSSLNIDYLALDEFTRFVADQDKETKMLVTKLGLNKK